MGKTPATPDPYGSKGVVPAASWTSSWAFMESEQLSACFERAADCPALTINQMEQLIQGLPPEDNAWPHPVAALECASLAIRELRFAFASGVLVHPISPAQFTDWCDSVGWDLPELLVDRVRNPPSVAMPAECPAPAPSVGPAWAPLGAYAVKADTKKPKRRRGRPVTNFGQIGALVAAGNEVLRQAADAGKPMTREDVAKALFGTHAAGRKSTATIRRLLSGKLHLEHANATAAQVLAKKIGGR